jgi:hypothetical protein
LGQNCCIELHLESGRRALTSKSINNFNPSQSSWVAVALALNALAPEIVLVAVVKDVV